MYRRKLIALEYHHPEEFAPHDENQFRSLIVWLEDRIIRRFQIAEREFLRDTNNSDWDTVFAKYLEDLECPVDSGDRNKVTGWLLSYAIKLKYKDNSETYNQIHEEKLERKMHASSINEVSPGSIGAIKGDDPDLKYGVISLSKLLGIPEHPDHITILQAVKTIIEERLSNSQIEARKNIDEGSDFLPLKDVSLGLRVGDPAVEEAAKIVRLLHLHELRDLQTQINKAIVLVQKLTANPKTDQSLGKVGR